MLLYITKNQQGPVTVMDFNTPTEQLYITKNQQGPVTTMWD